MFEKLFTPSVDRILRSFEKTVEKLNRTRDVNVDAAETAEVQAHALFDVAEAKRREAKRAAVVADRIKNLISQ